MKRMVILMVVTCLIGITGCKKNGISVEDINLKISSFFNNGETHDDSNFCFNYVDEKEKVVIVGLIDNNADSQEKFLSEIFDSKYINIIEKESLIKFNNIDENENVSDSCKLKIELKKLEKEYEKLKNSEDDLIDDVEKLKDIEYIEKNAQEKFRIDESGNIIVDNKK